MDTNERTERAGRQVSVVFTGPGLSQPDTRDAIEEAGLLGDYKFVRSGTQFTVTATLPEKLDFNTVVAHIANILGGRASGMAGGNNPDAVIRVDKQHDRSPAAKAFGRFRRASGTMNRGAHLLSRPGQASESPAPVTTALSGAEGALIPPVLQQPNAGPRSDVPSESRGESSARRAFSRTVGAVKFGFLAIATGLAILLEPFTEDEQSESNGHSEFDS